MVSFLMLFWTTIGALALGFVVGALVMRNNYKHFMKEEDEIRATIMDSRASAQSKLLKIRNLLNI